MPYCLDVSTIVGWFAPSVLPRHPKLPALHVMTAYRIRLDPRAHLASGTDPCGDCHRTQVTRLGGRVNVQCWRIPGTEKKCACCALRISRTCSFETSSPHTRTAVSTSAPVIQQLDTILDAHRRAVEEYVDTLTDKSATTRITSTLQELLDLRASRFGDLSIRNESTDVCTAPDRPITKEEEEDEDMK